jgi:hypothetical protein
MHPSGRALLWLRCHSDPSHKGYLGELEVMTRVRPRTAQPTITTTSTHADEDSLFSASFASEAGTSV